jgi:hypothetical protein
MRRSDVDRLAIDGGHPMRRGYRSFTRGFEELLEVLLTFFRAGSSAKYMIRPSR